MSDMSSFLTQANSALDLLQVKAEKVGQMFENLESLLEQARAHEANLQRQAEAIQTAREQAEQIADNLANTSQASAERLHDGEEQARNVVNYFADLA